MSRLELESATDLIDLDPLGPPQEGWFASAGATGFGLIGRDTQWSQGVGHGSTFRNARELARVFDLPIHGKGANRSAMQTLLSRMAVALADPCTLRFTDAGAAVWELTVVRTGGGDYAYGSDADNPDDDELNIVVTVQTDGSPFWRRVTGQSLAIPKTALGAVSIINAGDAPGPAVWTFTGPGILARLVSPSGEVLPWNGVVSPGEVLTIDTAARTAVDNLGRNRYGSFGTAPRFPDLPGGTSAWTVEFDSTSAAYAAAFPASTYNFVRPPIVDWDNVIEGWSDSDRLLWTSGLSSAAVTNNDDGTKLQFTVIGSGLQAELTQIITGLTIGQEYRFGATVSWHRGKGTTQPHFGPYISVDGVQALAGRDRFGTTTELRGVFVATATTATVKLGAGTHKNWNSSSTSYLWDIFVTDDPASVHFNGDTPDVTGITYSWEGVVDASRSIKVIPATPPPSNATTKVDVEWFPRRWAVI